jgi:hypothetical protein
VTKALVPVPDVPRHDDPRGGDWRAAFVAGLLTDQLYRPLTSPKEIMVVDPPGPPSPTRRAAPTDPGDLTWNAEIQEKTLDRLLEAIRAVDTKTSSILAIDTAMIAIIVAVVSAATGSTTATGLWIAVGTFLLVMSLLMVGLATFPQLEGPKDSLVYFGAIASQPYAKYSASVSSRSPATHLEDLSAQCHRNAQIASSKFRRLRYATLLLLFGIGPWLVSLYAILQR